MQPDQTLAWSGAPYPACIVTGQFSTGSLATLNRTGVREALLAFHQKYYTVPQMRLAVLGKA